MIVTIKTTVGFKPIDEFEEHKKFIEENDISKWRKDESTVLITYTKTDVFSCGNPYVSA